MAMGSRHCTSCGAAISAGRAFCPMCGAPVAAAPPAAAAPVAPPPAPVWSAPPQTGQSEATAPAAPPPVAAAPVAAPTAPAWGAPSQTGQPQAWAGSAPAAPAKPRANQAIIIGGALVALVLIGAVGFFVLNGNSSGGPVPGTYTINPSSLSCSQASPVTLTITLPASVKGAHLVKSRFDGADWGGQVAVSTYFTSQPDGTWRHEDKSPDLGACHGPGGQLSQGTHKLQLVDSSGKVLAEVSFTVTQ